MTADGGPAGGGASGRVETSGRRPVVALAVLAALAALFLLWAGRGITFLGDEWTWLVGGLDLSSTVLEDYNGHLNAVTQAFYAWVPEVGGLGHYWVYRVLTVAGHLVVVVLVYALARRRLGAWAALGPAAIIAFLGTGADTTLHAIEIGLIAAVAACLGALLLLDRGTWRGDLAASMLLLAGLASFSSAVAFLAGVWVEVLWRPDRMRRLWIPLAPTLLYLGWRLHWSGSLVSGAETAGNTTGGPLDVLGHAVEAAAGSVAGLLGVQLASPTLQDHLPWLDGAAKAGTVLLGLALAAWVASRRALEPRQANVLATGSLLWLLTAVGRGGLGDLTASRYVYQGAVVVALIVVGLLPPELLHRRLPAIALTSAVVASVALNAGWTIVWANHLRSESWLARAQLAALDVAGAAAPRQLRPTRAYALEVLTAGRYASLRAHRRGTAAFSVSELRRQTPETRAAADEVLLRALGPSYRLGGAAATGGAAPAVERVRVGRLVRRGSCVRTARGAVLDLRPRSAPLLVRGTAGGRLGVSARRFGPRLLRVPGTVAAGTATLVLPLGGAPDPWRVQVASFGAGAICSGR